MLISIICFIVAFGATLVGSLSGLGGGVIIKPALDVMAASQLTLAEISALSSVTVFSMAALSTCKGIQRGIPLNLNLLLPLALSSGIGGILGNHAFTKAMKQFGESLCRNVQSVTLFLLMAMILILYLADKRCRPLHLTGKKKIAAAGLFLGALSSFLGIGGGPVNVVALKLLFSFNEREQVFGSLFIILFAQASKLLALLFRGLPFSSAALPLLMAAGGILGGNAGSSLAIRLPEKAIRKVFAAAVLLVILILVVGFFKA